MADVIDYRERYRPQFHFTARKGWINDPNGCVFHNGEYHLFFQHNPAGLEWGNITWGHAVSRDLIHWHQLPDAIKPYKGGFIFSGSAVVDLENMSGLGREDIVPLVAVFTHAKKPFGQAIAYSLDNGRIWDLFKGGRHVVPNQGLDDGERDPKVFWHHSSKRWVMVLWVQKGRLRFFTSLDLKQWTHASDFFSEGFYECPDIFALPLDGNTENMKWIITDASYNYLVGSFNGTHFLPETTPAKGDYGHNFYAAQVWNNTIGRIVQIGWMRGGKFPGMMFNQQMSFPCELFLRTTSNGIRLCRMPVREIENLRLFAESFPARILKNGEKLSTDRRGDLFDITAEIETTPNAEFLIGLYNMEIVFNDKVISILGQEISVEGTDIIDLRILVDRASIEIYLNKGEICVSSCFMPSEEDTTIELHVKKGEVKISSITAYTLCSTW